MIVCVYAHVSNRVDTMKWPSVERRKKPNWKWKEKKKNYMQLITISNYLSVLYRIRFVGKQNRHVMHRPFVELFCCCCCWWHAATAAVEAHNYTYRNARRFFFSSLLIHCVDDLCFLVWCRLYAVVSIISRMIFFFFFNLFLNVVFDVYFSAHTFSTSPALFSLSFWMLTNNKKIINRYRLLLPFG